MDKYDLQSAVKPFVTFIEDLTNWYIRRSRRRFWKADDDICLLYTSPSPRDLSTSRMPSSA